MKEAFGVSESKGNLFARNYVVDVGRGAANSLLAGEPRAPESPTEEWDRVKEQRWREALDAQRLRFQELLRLDNVSFLFGTGSSMEGGLGAVSIGKIPVRLEHALLRLFKGKDNTPSPEAVLFYSACAAIASGRKTDCDETGAADACQTDQIKQRLDQVEDWGSTPDEKSNTDCPPLHAGVEHLLSLLYAMAAVENRAFADRAAGGWLDVRVCGQQVPPETLHSLISAIKHEFWKLCDLRPDRLDDQGRDKLRTHKQFIKQLLTRSPQLGRASIFTTNYDVAFEHAMEALGVTYRNGFDGFHRRAFRPAVFHSDLYYPGSATEGKVRRVESVLNLLKLHGSLTWVRTEPSAENIYGLLEKPIDEVRSSIENPPEGACDTCDEDNVMIYPTPLKHGFTLDAPYSDMFRFLADAITRPESALFTIGYSFSDEHINRIIYQALSIPSFSLVIIDPALQSRPEQTEEAAEGSLASTPPEPGQFALADGASPFIRRLIASGDPRVTIVTGSDIGTFSGFVRDLMPDLGEADTRERVAETLRKLYPTKPKGGGETGGV